MHNRPQMFEIQNEQKWVYIRYTKGPLEKGAYIFKSEPNVVINYLNQFFCETKYPRNEG